MISFQSALRKVLFGTLGVLPCAALWAAPGEQTPTQRISRRTPVVEAYEKVSPAVVNISTERTVLQRRSPFFNFETGGNLEDFFGDFFGKPQYGKQNVPLSIGSGVIIDNRGHVLTNEHVLQKASKIRARLKDGREFEARVIGTDPATDLAVLRLLNPGRSAVQYPYVTPAQSDDLMTGETVIAIGNPFGLSDTVTTGIVSGRGRSIETNGRRYDDFVQIDAAINPGNSGGALLNIRAELIGINTAIYKDAQGIGFAIPISLAKRVVDDLLRYGKVQPAYLGFQVWEQKGGIWVSSLEREGPGARAGLKNGDRLLNCAQKPLKKMGDFQGLLTRLAPGEVLECSVQRLDGEAKVSIVSSVFPADYWKQFCKLQLGLSVVQSGSRVVVSEVFQGGAAQQIGMAPGDGLVQINDTSIDSVGVLKDLIPTLIYRSSLLLVVERQGFLYYVTVDLDRIGRRGANGRER